MKRLPSHQRDFFSRVYLSAFENPFSASRLAADASATGLSAADGPDSLLDALLAKLDAELRTLAGGAPLDVRDFSYDDACLVTIALLFQVFHRHRRELDRYILAQSASPGGPLPAPCAAAMFDELRAAGFPREEAEKCVAVLFQLRRAFHFIHNGLQGDCPSMRALRVDLWNAVFTCDTHLYLDCLWNRMEDFSTLLLGETGTGKGAAAAALGRSGFIPYLPDRRTFAESFLDAFLPINLSEFAEGLIESELFGHRKGAFTGAIGDHEGAFARCSRHGAVFLDEIGDVSVPVQTKLLRVLQERVFSPVGGHRTQRFSGRIIAATHQDLAQRRADGRFRNDFYYRLSSCSLRLPPLRKRLAEDPGELRLLLGETVRRLVGESDGDLVLRIEEALRRDLPADYPWPGNVRELEQAARSVLLTGGYAGEAPVHPASADPGLARLLDGSLTLAEADAWYCRRQFERLGGYGAAAKRLGVDWRTVKQKMGK